MPHARSEPEVHSRRVSLHIGASPEAAWKKVVRPRLERIASRTLQDKNPSAVVTASRSQAYFFRNRLLGEGKSLLAVKFLSPPQLRELLLRGRDLRVPLSEHLRLILAVTAEEFASKSTDDETVLVAKSIARDADRFLRVLDELRTAGWTFDPTLWRLFPTSTRSPRPGCVKSPRDSNNKRMNVASLSFTTRIAPRSRTPGRCLAICSCSDSTQRTGRSGRCYMPRHSLPAKPPLF